MTFSMKLSSNLHFLQKNLIGCVLKHQFVATRDATHTVVLVKNYLEHFIPGRWIGRRQSIEWPRRLPALTHLDFFLCEHNKISKKSDWRTPKVIEKNRGEFITRPFRCYKEIRQL